MKKEKNFFVWVFSLWQYWVAFVVLALLNQEFLGYIRGENTAAFGLGSLLLEALFLLAVFGIAHLIQNKRR